MQIKTTLIYFLPTRTTKTKKDNHKCWQGYGEIAVGKNAAISEKFGSSSKS